MARRTTSATPSPSPAIRAVARPLLASALYAGLAAGLFSALLQFAFVTPLLLEGELYESGARVHVAAAPGAGAQTGAQSGARSGARSGPAAGPALARHALTAATSVVTFTGFGLMLVAGFALAERRGRRVTARRGLAWGLAGFLATGLAPAFGLPPELPGAVAANLGPRQIWWAGTALATAAGIASIALARTPATALIGAALIAAPHLVGAPRPDAALGLAPPELSALFAARGLGVAAASWGALGLIAGHLWNRQATGPRRPPSPAPNEA